MLWLAIMLSIQTPTKNRTPILNRPGFDMTRSRSEERRPIQGSPRSTRLEESAPRPVGSSEIDLVLLPDRVDPRGVRLDPGRWLVDALGLSGPRDRPALKLFDGDQDETAASNESNVGAHMLVEEIERHPETGGGLFETKRDARHALATTHRQPPRCAQTGPHVGSLVGGRCRSPGDRHGRADEDRG